MTADALSTTTTDRIAELEYATRALQRKIETLEKELALLDSDLALIERGQAAERAYYHYIDNAREDSPF